MERHGNGCPDDAWRLEGIGTQACGPQPSRRAIKVFGCRCQRSPHPNDDNNAFYVHSDGNVNNNNVSDSYGVRPALMVSPFSRSPTGGAAAAHHIKGAASFHAATAGGKHHVSGVRGDK
ncbi:MAG: DUF6273 domain-containing protein [Bacillota bacterium]